MNNLKSMYDMKKWKVYYRDKQDELQKCWVEANNKDEAKVKVKREYWDCERFVDVTPM